GQRVFGFVTVKDDADETVVSDTLENVAERLAAYKVPEDLKVLDKLPLSAIGKVDRKGLSKMASDLHEAGEFRTQDVASSQSRSPAALRDRPKPTDMFQRPVAMTPQGGE